MYKIDIPTYWLYSSKFCFSHLLERIPFAISLIKALLHKSVISVALANLSMPF